MTNKKKKAAAKKMAKKEAAAIKKMEQEGSFMVRIPEGAVPGQAFSAQAPNGEMIRLAVPPDTKPGDVITISAKAEKVDEEALAAAREAAEPSYQKGLEAMKAGKVEEASKFFTESLEILPSLSKALYQLGCCHFEAKDMEQAANCLARSIQHSTPDQTEPSRFDILFKLGSALLVVPKGLAKAVQALGDALKLNSAHEECKKQFAEASKLLTEAQERVTFKIPEGAQPGQKMKINLPTGESLKIQLPDDAKAGDELTVALPEKKQEMKITIPEGAAEGTAFTVMGPMGDAVNVTVPPGAQPGNMIKVTRKCNPQHRVIYSGMHAKITKLSGNPELNGKGATAQIWDTDAKRWAVQLDEGGPMLLLNGINLDPFEA